MTAQVNSTLKKDQTPVEQKTLYSWQAPERPFKKRDKEFFTTVAAIAVLLAVIFLFIKEWMAIGVIASLVFVGYVLATVEPKKIGHEITTRGIVTGGRLYKWEELTSFWFSKKWKDEMLNVSTNLKFPMRLVMLIGDGSEKELKKHLQKEIQFEEPEETLMDKSAKWLQEKVPLETEN
jgi:hypothetical protein